MNRNGCGLVAGSESTSIARLIAVQGLYEMEIAGAAIDDVVLFHLENRWAGQLGEEDGVQTGVRALAKSDRKKFSAIVRGVTQDRGRLDELISGALTDGQEIDRLDVILRIIMRAGAFEMFSLPRVPARVVINEYVDVANAFYDEGEPALVNGVLDRIGRILRPAELDPNGSSSQESGND
ncbi:MAG: transcription antitermination factor NusB [Rhodospirillaceae bacterium]|jgi:N utilization substance protein B|nr:transcription antitermination factor NusB [Rhodospirillaceae bacterium]|tara:strand:- start:384 stop:923 length:540 start_codon:yes stop_codon:yes gene_type:complete